MFDEPLRCFGPVGLCITRPLYVLRICHQTFHRDVSTQERSLLFYTAARHLRKTILSAVIITVMGCVSLIALSANISVLLTRFDGDGPNSTRRIQYHTVPWFIWANSHTHTMSVSIHLWKGGRERHVSAHPPPTGIVTLRCRRCSTIVYK